MQKSLGWVLSHLFPSPATFSPDAQTPAGTRDFPCPPAQSEGTGTTDPVLEPRSWTLNTLLAGALVAPLLPQSSVGPLPRAARAHARVTALRVPASLRTDPLPACCETESETCCSQKQTNGSVSGGDKTPGKHLQEVLRALFAKAGN